MTKLKTMIIVVCAALIVLLALTACGQDYGAFNTPFELTAQTNTLKFTNR